MSSLFSICNGKGKTVSSDHFELYEEELDEEKFCVVIEGKPVYRVSNSEVVVKG